MRMNELSAQSYQLEIGDTALRYAKFVAPELQLRPDVVLVQPCGTGRSLYVEIDYRKALGKDRDAAARAAKALEANIRAHSNIEPYAKTLAPSERTGEQFSGPVVAFEMPNTLESNRDLSKALLSACLDHAHEQADKDKPRDASQFQPLFDTYLTPHQAKWARLDMEEYINPDKPCCSKR